MPQILVVLNGGLVEKVICEPDAGPAVYDVIDRDLLEVSSLDELEEEHVREYAPAPVEGDDIGAVMRDHRERIFAEMKARKEVRR